MAPGDAQADANRSVQFSQPCAARVRARQAQQAGTPWPKVRKAAQHAVTTRSFTGRSLRLGVKKGGDLSRFVIVAKSLGKQTGGPAFVVPTPLVRARGEEQADSVDAPIHTGDH